MQQQQSNDNFAAYCLLAAIILIGLAFALTAAGGGA